MSAVRLVLCVAVGLSACASTPRAVTGALARSVPLLQASGETWIQKQDCTSCHHQALGAMAAVVAGERGVPVDRALLERQRARILREFDDERDVLLGFGSEHILQIRSYRLVALAATGAAPTLTTAAVARFLARTQGSDGSWRPVFQRPPLEGSLFTLTATALRSLQLYGTERDDVDARVARARAWLARAAAQTTEDRAMQLLGLAWAGAGANDIGRARAALLGEQRADGGWAQIPGAGSDAYATGEALVALRLGAGLAVASAPYRRGVDYLLRGQLADGSWHVRTRRRRTGLQYFETGFPHGVDQFISYPATALATMALALTLEPDRPTVLMAPARRAPAPLDGTLFRAASFGTAADVAARLDDTHPRAPDGATPLVRAVDDEAKVRLLLERATDVNLATTSGLTPVIAAAGSNGPVAVLRLLIERGADVNVMTKDGCSALMLAASIPGNLEKVRLLLQAGARPSPRPGEKWEVTPLFYAVGARNLEAVQALLEAGADTEASEPELSDAEGDRMTPLMHAAVNGFADVVALLVEHGANLEARDGHGMTALMWAATVDTGGTEIVRLLVERGADVNARTQDGRSALSQARAEGRGAIAALLVAAGARP